MNTSLACDYICAYESRCYAHEKDSQQSILKKRVN